MRISARAAAPEPRTPGERNAILLALSTEEYDRLQPDFERVSLRPRDVLFEPEQTIEHVYFMQEGVLSLLAMDEDAGAVEVGTIGNEGMAGLTVFHGMDASPQQCFCQIDGVATRLSADIFRRELPSLTRLQAQLHRYAQCFFNDVAQSVACMRLHSVQQRCARWLLMTHDRVGGRTFVLKQSFLSYILGTPRNSVSAAATALAKRGLIRYARGRIEVLDRAGLESAACSCYRMTRVAYDDLLSSPAWRLSR